jgi:hypothetical protein
MKNQKTFNHLFSKNHFVCYLFLLLPIGVLAQFPKPKPKKEITSSMKIEFKIDSISGLYQYQEIFDIPNTNQSEIYNRIKSIYCKVKANIEYEKEPEKLKYTSEFSITALKMGGVRETFDIKDNKLRWTVTDLMYHKNAGTILRTWDHLENKEDPTDLLNWLKNNWHIARDYLIKNVVSPTQTDKNWE